MSNEASTPHTLETLEALPRKADVVAIAEQMGLDTSGTRAEISALIVAALALTGDAPPDENQDAPEGSDAPEPATAPVEDVAPQAGPKPPGRLSLTAKAELKMLVGTYLGVDEAEPELAAIAAAVEDGKQPCIVEGTGNRRFAVTIFDQPFDLRDVLCDVSPGRDGVIMNLARTLETKSLIGRD